jgi:hypothetical protein
MVSLMRLCVGLVFTNKGSTMLEDTEQASLFPLLPDQKPSEDLHRNSLDEQRFNVECSAQRVFADFDD